MSKVLTVLVAAGVVLGLGSIALGDSFVGEVTSNNAALRAGGSMVHHTVASLPAGVKVVVTQQQGDWYVVRVPRNVPVYISAKWVKREGGDEGVVNGDRVNLRATPDTKYAALGVANNGVRVQILGESDGFLKIVPPDTCVGWMYKSQVRKLSGVGAADVEEDQYREVRRDKEQVKAAEQANSQVKASFDAGCEALLRDDLEGARQLFDKVIREGKGTPYAEAGAHQLNLVKAKIDEKQRFDERQKRLQQRSAELEDKLLNDLLDMYKKAVDDIKPRKPVYAATGTLKGLGMMVLRRGTHKIVDSDDVVLYTLRAAPGSAIDLYDATYFEKKVGILGTVLEVPGYGKVIEVTRIDLLE